MRELIKTIKDFKIIPANFKSATTFELVDVVDDVAKIKILFTQDDEKDDFKPNSSVEIFGVNNVGLVYFETKIISIDNEVAEIVLVNDYSVIQRREYSRVELNNGIINFGDLAPDIVENVEDISAGGLRFVTKTQFEIDRQYSISIKLSNNMKIDCVFQPIRIVENEGKYVVSGRFLELENMDRIVLVQYAFKIKMEQQNKTDNLT